MKEIMVAYWSGTGNTAAMATILGKGIQDGGATAKVVSVEDIKADDLKDYPVFALGCPSMGNETLEETVMEDFVTEVESFASGKKIGLFGSYGWGDGEWDAQLGCTYGRSWCSGLRRRRCDLHE